MVIVVSYLDIYNATLIKLWKHLLENVKVEKVAKA